MTGAEGQSTVLSREAERPSGGDPVSLVAYFLPGSGAPSRRSE